MSEHSYAVYIITNKTNHVLYIGVTNNLIRRMIEHQAGRVPGFTQKYFLRKLVYYETGSDVYGALCREKQLKGWLRRKKIALIESTNPHWRDLLEDLLPTGPSLRSG